MTKNSILEELRETREKLLADAGGTLDGLVAQLQHDECQSDRQFYCPIKRTEALPVTGTMRVLPQGDNIAAGDRQ